MLEKKIIELLAKSWGFAPEALYVMKNGVLWLSKALQSRLAYEKNQLIESNGRVCVGISRKDAWALRPLMEERYPELLVDRPLIIDGEPTDKKEHNKFMDRYMNLFYNSIRETLYQF